MFNILINAYAVSPSWGSEPGMAWNWISHIAKHCNVFVITEGEWKEDILIAVEKHPNRENMHFYFAPVDTRVRSMCWNQGDWRFYYYYAKWQKRALATAREIVAENHIDVMHQLNMIGFREPGYLYKIKNIPLVWGPIGGVANIPTAFLKGIGLKQNIFFRLKNVISDAQFRFHPRVRAMMHRAYPIAAVKAMQDKTRKFYHREIPLMNETGTEVSACDNFVRDFNCDTMRILWVGRFIPTKRLDIALETIAKCKYNVHLTVCGTGSETEVMHYKQLAENLNIADMVTWMGLIPNVKVQQLMRVSDAFLFTSIAEGTPHVILEALKNRLPVVCFDMCGQGEVIDETVGIKIMPRDSSSAVTDFAEALDKLCRDSQLRQQLSANCRAKQLQCSWDSKIDKVLEVYQSLALNNA
jgi:glycosyltransferase involved in cell wall biosynthesis